MPITSFRESWGERLVESILLIPLLLSVFVLVLAAILTQLIFAFVQMVMDGRFKASLPVYTRTIGRPGLVAQTTFGGKASSTNETLKVEPTTQSLSRLSH